jgi:hypothetical protein
MNTSLRQSKLLQWLGSLNPRLVLNGILASMATIAFMDMYSPLKDFIDDRSVVGMITAFVANMVLGVDFRGEVTRLQK